MNNSKQVIQYLEEVAQILLQLRVILPFHILVAGGAYMLLQEKRKSTKDIDFALLEPPQVIPTEPFRIHVQKTEISKHTIPYALEFQQAIDIVAHKHKNLEDDWLNDEAAIYYYDDTRYAEVTFWRSFGNNILHVYLPTLEYMFATKIAAYRPKDMKDIQSIIHDLQIQTREQAQAIVDTFLLPDAQEFYEVDKRLRRLFH